MKAKKKKRAVPKKVAKKTRARPRSKPPPKKKTRARPRRAHSKSGFARRQESRQFIASDGFSLGRRLAPAYKGLLIDVIGDSTCENLTDLRKQLLDVLAARWEVTSTLEALRNWRIDVKTAQRAEIARLKAIAAQSPASPAEKKIDVPVQIALDVVSTDLPAEITAETGEKTMPLPTRLTPAAAGPKPAPRPLSAPKPVAAFPSSKAVLTLPGRPRLGSSNVQSPSAQKAVASDDVRRMRKYNLAKLQQLTTALAIPSLRGRIGSTTQGPLLVSELLQYLLVLEGEKPAPQAKRNAGEPPKRRGRKSNAERAAIAAAAGGSPPVANPAAVLKAGANGVLMKPAPRPLMRLTPRA